jgi:hypothetical protein
MNERAPNCCCELLSAALQLALAPQPQKRSLAPYIVAALLAGVALHAWALPVATRVLK